jgi:hypothetical protein
VIDLAIWRQPILQMVDETRKLNNQTSGDRQPRHFDDNLRTGNQMQVEVMCQDGIHSQDHKLVMKPVASNESGTTSVMEQLGEYAVTVGLKMVLGDLPKQREHHRRV